MQKTAVIYSPFTNYRASHSIAKVESFSLDNILEWHWTVSSQKPTKVPNTLFRLTKNSIFMGLTCYVLIKRPVWTRVYLLIVEIHLLWSWLQRLYDRYPSINNHRNFFLRQHIHLLFFSPNLLVTIDNTNINLISTIYLDSICRKLMVANGCYLVKGRRAGIDLSTCWSV